MAVDVIAAARGDGVALEAFARWAWPCAHRVAYMTTGDRSISQDISQRGVARCYESIAQFRPFAPHGEDKLSGNALVNPDFEMIRTSGKGARELRADFIELSQREGTERETILRTRTL